jgi:hypothetical protein
LPETPRQSHHGMNGFFGSQSHSGVSGYSANSTTPLFYSGDSQQTMNSRDQSYYSGESRQTMTTQLSDTSGSMSPVSTGRRPSDAQGSVFNFNPIVQDEVFTEIEDNIPPEPAPLPPTSSPIYIIPTDEVPKYETLRHD